MGRSPCCNENDELKKGPWLPEEDKKLVEYVNKNGHGSWRALPKLAGLNRCGKSCRLRWANYLRPDIKRGKFSDEEEQIIIKLHSVLGNKWSTIAQRLPGRTDNEIKNYWNTHLKKKLLQSGIDPVTHMPRMDHLNFLTNLPQLLATASNFGISMNPLNNVLTLPSADVTQLAKAQLLHTLLQVLSKNSAPNPRPISMEALKFAGNLSLHQPLYDEFTQMNTSLEGLVNFPFNFAADSAPVLSNSSNSNAYPPNQQVCTTTEMDVFSGDYKLDNDNQSLAIWPTENSLPALVSGSPECSTMNQMEKTNTRNDSNKASSSSNTFDAWEELVEDETGDRYWKEILDQVSSPSWQIS